MGALVWLVIPAVAAVAAAIWGRWAGRRRIAGDGASLAGYERFRAAMEREPALLGAAGQRVTGERTTDGSADGAPAAGGGATAGPATAGHAAGSGGRRRWRRERAAVPGRDVPATAAQAPAGASRTADAQLAARIDASLATGPAGADEEGSPTGPVAGSVP